MPVQGRDQLKRYFRNGNLAREEYFIDLIDSSVNKVSDLFTISEESGVNVLACAKGNRFFSLFNSKRSAEQQKPSFTIQYREDDNNNPALSFETPAAGDALQSLLFVKKELKNKGRITGKVGINTCKPQTELDVNGSVSMKARIGTFRDSVLDYSSIKADGKWHPVVTRLNGLSAFEIVAGVSGSGNYSMVFCVAMNVPGRTGTIKPVKQIYGSWFHRLQLRWSKGVNGNYSLEIRTAWRFKGTPQIHLRITRLWN